jgi:hypothetical protein
MGRLPLLVALIATVAFASAADAGPDAPTDPGNRDVGESKWCPAFREQLKSAEDYKAANAGHPRMNEIDQAISMARTALDACLKQARDIAEHGTAAQQYADSVRRQQREAEQREAAEQLDAEEKMRDPVFGRARLSALLCYVASARKHAKEILDEQRQGARAGLGVIDKELVYEYQGELVILSKVERMVKADLKTRKVSALACKPEPSQTFADCIHNSRMAPATLDPGENEHTAEAERVVGFSLDCTPWDRLAQSASAASDAPADRKPRRHR